MRSWSTHKIKIGKPQGKRPLRRERYRLVNNSRINLWEKQREGAEWIHVAQDRASGRLL
jgi:hypothetical protein